MTVLFSKKCEYALRGVLYLAAYEERRISVPEIADKLNIPSEFLAKILQDLVAHNILESKKGKSGGFKLKRPADEIKMIDVVLAIDGNWIFEGCVLGFQQCNSVNPCPLHENWSLLKENAFSMLNSITFDSTKSMLIRKIFEPETTEKFNGGSEEVTIEVNGEFEKIENNN